MTKEDKIIMAVYLTLTAMCVACVVWCARSVIEIGSLSKDQTRDLKGELNNFWIQQKYLEQEIAELKARLRNAEKQPK